MNELRANFRKYKKRIIQAIILIIFTLILILVAASLYFITLDDGTYKEGDMGNVPYAASTYIKSIKFTEDGIKFIYTHTDETTGELLSETKTSSEMAQIVWDEMYKSGTTVGNYLDSVEELEELMNAEVITQYPKLDKNVELNGTIEFERRKTDGTTVKLQFINLENFNKYIENKDISIVNYYTMDENENILIGVVDQTTETLTSDDSDMVLSDYADSLSDSDMSSTGNYSKTEYNVYSKSINYKSIVSKYTMPFQYLWSFIVTGDDKEVGLDLAKLVENSEIVISIFDNITENEDVSTYTYKKERKVNVSATSTSETNYGKYTKSDKWENENAVIWKEDDTYTIKHTITYKNNIPIVDITKADVWIVDYSKEYDYSGLAQTSQEINSRDIEDTDYADDGENPKKSSKGDGTDLSYYDKFKDKLEGLKKALEKEIEKNVKLKVVNGVTDKLTMSTSITSCEASYYKHQVEKKEKDVSTEYSQKYVAKTPVNNPKVEKKTEEEIKKGTGQDNFVTILCDAKHTNARNKITNEITDWLFEMLEENSDTVNMVDLTSYLLYKVTGDDKRFNDSYDFSEYEKNEFNSVSSGIYNGTIQEKVWFALKDLGCSDVVIAGAMGNIDYESAGFSTVAVEGNGQGIGLCQWSFGRKTQFLNYAKSKGVSWQDEDTQVEFLITEISGQGAAVGYATQRTSGYIKSEGITSTATDWKNSTTVEDSTLHFMRFFESPGNKTSLGERQNRANKYYQEFQGKEPTVDIDTELTGDNKEKMQQMLTEAVRIANDDRYKYSQAFRESEFYYDCSSFVSRLYSQFFGITRLDSGSAGRGTDNIKANCKAKYSQISMSALQPGDILWKDGHVALYIGNGQLAEALNENKGIMLTTRINQFAEAYRVVK